MEQLAYRNGTGSRLLIRRWFGLAARNSATRPAAQAPTARLAALTLLAICAFGHSALQAQLPIARLHTVFPPGGQAGTTVDVSVTGVDLDDLSQMLFSQTNVLAKLEPAEESRESEPRRFRVTIGADVPVGLIEARVVGRFGVSNPRAFAISDRPETSLATTNHFLGSAALIELGKVVNSQLDTNAVDYFKFIAKAGQLLSLECLTRQIDSRMQEVLVVMDSAGRELARHRLGGPLDFRTPAEGTYVLQVHDVTYRHGPEFFYRLALNTAPRLDSVFPPSGLAGTRSSFTLQGHNLPGSSAKSGTARDGQLMEVLGVEIELPAGFTNQPDILAGLALPPASAGIDAIAYRLASPEATSNPVLIGVASDAVVVESEPNDKPEQAQQIKVPCELVGRFQPSGDRDWSSFEAKKGEVFWVEVFSHRLGQATDPFVLIQRVTRNDKGVEKVADVLELNDADTNIGGPGFNTATRDPVGRFEVPEDGIYRLCIRDLFHNPDFEAPPLYRLSLHRESPDFRLVALPQAPPPLNRDTREALVWTSFLRRGETTPIRVLAFRRDGFKGGIQLDIQGLPPSVTMGPAQIDPDKSSALIYLTTTPDAPAWSGPIQVTGRARIGETDVVRMSRFAEVTWNVADYNNEPIQSRLAGEMFLAVSDVELVPIAIVPTEPRMHEAEAGAKLQIPLRIDRHGEFAETLKLKPTGWAALESMKELEVDGKTNSATLELDLAPLKLSPGNYTFELQAQTKGKYKNNSNDAKQVDALAKEAGVAANKAREGLEVSKADAKRASKALAEAAKAADEAAALVKSVTDGEKQAAEARTGKALDLKVEAEKAAAAASAAVKEAEEKKMTLEKRARELEEKSKPKEVTITVYSEPITIRVKDEAKK